ncbi:MAG TPA: PQQ-binding-like beta-propeller repeat protein [Bryobacteraceae bacterium]|nr:PQQ-binding-like beta-propeller repeat protein [Bryobacteraceae bacterium]
MKTVVAILICASSTGLIRAQDAPPTEADAKLMPNRCASTAVAADWSTQPAWNGWGAGITNARFQTESGARITPDQVSRLKLKWAFGFPGAKAVYGQPTVVAGRVFLGVDTGYVYSIDAATGCVYWSYQAAGPVRAAVSVGPGKARGSALAYIGDLKGNVYALNAATGEQVWKVQADTHPQAHITGAPQLYRNRLYVPVASGEEGAATDPSYQCCTFRGSVVALDALTGRRIWKTYIISDTPKPSGKNSKGVQLFAPSGGGVWNAPTIDPKRHALYIGTGDAYTQPAPKTTDSIMALDLDNGKVLWSVQDTSGDAWVVSCIAGRGAPENCPKDAGPDYDFGSSPILVTLADGRNVLIAGQKSGNVWAHDPEHKGAVLWKTPVVSKPPEATGQITFGGGADDRNAYFGLNSGGVVALSLTNGEREWFSDITPASGRKSGQDAAVSIIPGVIFSGGWDGVLRALSTKDGTVLWQFDMAREFDTVNHVPAKGGSMGASGPTVAGGMVFAGAGYPGVQSGRNGNVLLAFGVE